METVVVFGSIENPADGGSFCLMPSAISPRTRSWRWWYPLRSRALVPKIRNEIVRDLVSQMFSFDSKPQKEFCTQVAKLLVKKYTFMQDVGQKVSGYVSYLY